MNFLYKNLSVIARKRYNRLDFKYWQAQNSFNFETFVPIKNLFYIINGTVQTENYSDVKTSIPYIRISNLDYKYGVDTTDIVYLNEDTKIDEEKRLRYSDIIFATIGSVGKVGLAKDVVGGTHSNNTVVLRAKEGVNAQFYEKLFQTDIYRKYINGLIAQKAQPNLQQYELENIKIPYESSETIETTLTTIKPIEYKIVLLNEKIKDTQTIIDETLKSVFHFDYNKFNELKNIKHFSTGLSEVGKNYDLRFSAKYHRRAGEFVQKELWGIPGKKIKDFLFEPIVLGASVSPAEYDENGEYVYLSMATIKDWAFNAESAQFVNNTYSTAKSEKTVAVGDIILARSGEGTIGKVAYIKDDVKAVFADFTMRIRLKDYNAEFAYYYMRSTYYQYLIEIYKKGLGNNTNIFPIVIQEFPLPDISIDEQKDIVAKIQEEINKQNEIKTQISILRSEIDNIIERAISEN